MFFPNREKHATAKPVHATKPRILAWNPRRIRHAGRSPESPFATLLHSAIVALLFWLGLISIAGAAATIPPSVLAEVAARGHASVLVELAQNDETDVLNDFRLERKGTCRILQSWRPVRVMHVDATAGCLDGIRGAVSVAAVELTGAGFVAAADSLTIPRYQRATILGAGLPEGRAELREVFRQEACFCTAGTGGCCPGGVTQQLGEQAAATTDSRRSTENLAFDAARPGHANIIDGTNIILSAIRIVAPHSESVSMVSVLDALNWLAQSTQPIGILVLSFESDEVYCGPCEARTVANRAMAAYFQLLRARGVRILAPDLGFRIRGAPACLPGVERFPASVDLPRFSAELKPLGRMAGAISSISTFTSATAPPAGWASGPGTPSKVVQLQFQRPATIVSTKEYTVPSVYVFHYFGAEFLFQNARGLLYYLIQGSSYIYVLQHGQVSSCSLPELVNDQPIPP